MFKHRSAFRNSCFVATLFVLISLIVAACSPGDGGNPEGLETAASMATQESAVLPSWNDRGARQALIELVERVSDPASPDFVPESERIATFDNDGTLWSEKPVYFQLLFAIDRLRELAPDHPEWQGKQPFQGAIDGDLEAVAAAGEHGLLELMMASHAGMTTVEFGQIVSDWVEAARHPVLDRPYTDLVYQPMLELLDYLRSNGFTTYIVSGGGIEFMRPWAERVYGVPPQQVIGSSIKVELEERDGEPVLVRLPEIDFIDDKEGKPVGIHKFIGRRPVMAVGNSDGDFQMLQWATAGEGPSLGVLIHHTDAEREWAYDRDSHVGRLDRGLDEAETRGWVLVDMKSDWKTVYPPPLR